jgi:hypothetical protein
MRKKRRQEDPLMQLMEKQIDAEEERTAPDYYHKSLKNCAYYPRRPALKFIPMPDMAHVLLVQAVCLQFPKYRPNFKYPGRVDWSKMAHVGSVRTGTGFDSADSHDSPHKKSNRGSK